MPRADADTRALNIAERLHHMAGARQTILFGSRARGDYRNDSDLDILILKDALPPEKWLEQFRDQARALQKKQLPEASGIDVICMTSAQFDLRRKLRNNLANCIAKQGAAVVPDDQLGYGMGDDAEEIDWEDVESRMRDATDFAKSLETMAAAGILGSIAEKVLGHTAQNALENAYKALLGAWGCAYPTSGRDGHNLRILAQLIREASQAPDTYEVPGEAHRYLTEFAGAAIYAHEHLPLNKELIAREIPEAIAKISEMIEAASR